MARELLGDWLGAFASTERFCYTGNDNDIFALAIGQVVRYATFVDIIFDRYDRINTELVATNNERMKAFDAAPVGRTFTDAENALFDAVHHLSLHLHLEVETFFLFAKILLDKAAHFVETYFGQGRGLSLKSHQNWLNSYQPYLEQKKITFNAGLPEMLSWFQGTVVEHRDKAIVHFQGPRTMFVTSFGPGEITGTVQIESYPKGAKSKQQMSPDLVEVYEQLDCYLRWLIEGVTANRSKSKFKLIDTATNTSAP